ncbi:hypothetical protein GCM10007094_25360 [Pseudovibrio japonicus]|uniref:Rap1a immunity protein domain-containing protein n=1 Tax=Pseudovibrio japonicus TaxID=366534 RepID=A0ABQ3EE32_9HYPH|nr:hypothetical protein [Pseudovibrio japonicus]GHB34853.1 hypothetical protein GCM10007094_25360 [Pseudovibrio japonicus]
MILQTVAGGLILFAASISTADAGYNQSRAEKFAYKQQDRITCYYLYGLSNQSGKQDVLRGLITASAYAKGMNKQEAIYAIAYGSGRIAATLAEDPDRRDELISEYSKDC